MTLKQHLTWGDRLALVSAKQSQLPYVLHIFSV